MQKNLVANKVYSEKQTACEKSNSMFIYKETNVLVNWTKHLSNFTTQNK